MSSCAAAGWGMYPSQAPGVTTTCPLCTQDVPVGWMTVAGRQVRLIQDHPPCR